MGTDVRLPPSLLFPIEIVQTLTPEGSFVKKQEPILKFKYWNRVPEGVPAEDDDEPKMVNKEFYGTFESPFTGQLTRFLVKAGDRIADHLTVVLRILESCDHSVQYGGLCAICGESLDTKDYMGYSDIDRAPIAMSHDTSGLTVSRTEAERIENTTTTRLLESKKLILVVDLDQTVIHAAVDPEIGSWISDQTSPYHNACKQVKSFVLKEKLAPPGQGRRPSVPQPVSSVNCTYYVKLRPGLNEFLEKMNELYEMHVYTMATKSYAAEISRLIDPDGKYFGDRVLSRDASGSLILKDLNRLFPVTQSLVTIIDDRADVWRWSPHLIRVAPYNFFSGTGDINSSYLPKRDGLVTPEGKEESKNEEEGASEHGDHELQNIASALTLLHRRFYEAYEDDHHNKIPDIGKLLPTLKAPVLEGCVLLFSGFFALGTDLNSADIVQWVRSFGAVVLADFLPSVTHVIAKTSGTVKVKQAAGAGKHVVKVQWIFACLEAWKHVPEGPFEIDVPDPILPRTPRDIETAGEEPHKAIADGFVRSLSRGDVNWDEEDEELKEILGSDYDEDEAVFDEAEEDISERPSPGETSQKVSEKITEETHVAPADHLNGNGAPSQANHNNTADNNGKLAPQESTNGIKRNVDSVADSANPQKRARELTSADNSDDDSLIAELEDYLS